MTRVNIVNAYNIHNERGGFGPLREGPHAYSNIDRAFSEPRVRGGISSMASNQFGRGSVPAQQQRFDAASLRQASLMTGANPVSPSRESFRPTDRQVSPSAIPNRSSANQRFFSSSRQGAAIQSQRAQAGFNRGGNSGGNQLQQNTNRPAIRSFGSANPGNSNGAPAFGQTVRSSPGNTQNLRGFTPPSSQQAAPTQSTRPGWRTFTPSSRESQPNRVVRTFEMQGEPQSRVNENIQPARPGASQPAGSQRQVQSYSRGNSSNGYYRQPLNMQQPVVTPRARSYSAPSGSPIRSAPNSGGSRGGRSGSGSRGGSSSAGGGHSSGHNR